MNNNLQLVKIIRDRITNSLQQQITFANYMEFALDRPRFGYYASNADRISRNGDFSTSPF
jgi:SAM-dependent MidA family methyltransferase